MKRCAWFGLLGLITAGGIFAAPASAHAVQAGEDVFQVLFPANTDHVFDFIMDPQELIGRTNAAAYGGLTFEEGATLFFRRHDGGAEEDYSSSSDALVITNMGTEDVDIVLTASVSPDSLEKISMTDDETFADDTETSLYLALTDGEHTIAIDREAGAVIHTTLEGVSGEDGAYREYRFWLMGAVNGNGDWSEVKEVVPEVTVTWSVATGKEKEAEEDMGNDGLPEKLVTEEKLRESEEQEAEGQPQEAEKPKTEEQLEETKGQETEEQPGAAEELEPEEQPGAAEELEPEEQPGAVEGLETEEQPGASEEPKAEEQPKEEAEEPETEEQPDAEDVQSDTEIPESRENISEQGILEEGNSRNGQESGMEPEKNQDQGETI